MKYHHACEFIAYGLFAGNVSPLSIWELSKTGELWHIHVLLSMAEEEMGRIGYGPRA